MRNHHFTRLATLAVAVALAGAMAGCDSSGATAIDTEVRPTDAMHFLRLSVNAPPLSNPVVSFYAKRGEDREAFIYFRPKAGTSDSSLFLRFKVPGASLERRPDGTLFRQGDSTLITIRVTDPSRMILDFQPSGLRFAATPPAELKIDFGEASDDLDGDGDEDALDTAHKLQLSLWRQEAAGLPWVRISSVLNFSAEELEAKLLGFSGYAISY
jgi:hypothetical protein